MSSPVRQFADSVDQIVKFAGKNLAATISELEFRFSGLDAAKVQERLQEQSIDMDLLQAARTIKKAAAQIDVILHTIGILTLLPSILDDGEIIESLSLGAGSSENKRFDLETDRRVAEFTFIDWKGNDNIRLQKIFKDFYRLAEFDTTKSKELWLTDDTHVLKFLRSGSSIRSATHKYRDVWEDFQAKYPAIERVSEYYRLRADAVKVRTYGVGASLVQ